MINRNQVFMPINLRIKIADDDPVIKLVEINRRFEHLMPCNSFFLYV